MLKLDVIVPDKDFRGFQTDILVGVADAIHLVSDELAQLGHITGVGPEIKQVQRRQ